MRRLPGHRSAPITSWLINTTVSMKRIPIDTLTVGNDTDVSATVQLARRRVLRDTLPHPSGHGFARGSECYELGRQTSMRAALPSGIGFIVQAQPMLIWWPTGRFRRDC